MTALLFTLLLLPPVARSQSAPQFSTISNGTITVGVDVNGGGSIGYLSPAGTNGNILNIHDFGRYVGQSYYSGPQPFGNPTSAYPNWPWNPVSAGDFFGNPSQIVGFQNDGSTIYVKSIPKQWALNNVASECTFETWITLQNNAVSVTNRLTNSRSDVNQYQAYSQEMPATYTCGRLFQLFSYTGNQPFTNDALTQVQNPPTSWAKYLATEEWSALVDSTGWGLGVFHPGEQRFAGGFMANGGQPGTGSPTDPATGYMGPLGHEILDHNIAYTYQYYLILGNLSDIRSFVYSHHQQVLPNYFFASDRQRFYYNFASDSGWPIQGHLHVNLGQGNAQVMSPTTAWQAQLAPQLFINAAYHLSTGNTPIVGQVALKYWGNAQFSQPVQFSVIPDGQYHIYQVNLNGQGLVTDLQFIPVANTVPGPSDSVDIASISMQGSAPPPPAPPLPGKHFHFHSPVHWHYHNHIIKQRIHIKSEGTELSHQR